MNNGRFDFLDALMLYLSNLPQLIFAILILVAGFIVASVVSKAVRKGMQKTNVDNRVFAGFDNTKYRPEVIVSKIVYYVILIFAFILFFNMLNLQIIAAPFVGMMSVITNAIPNILKAALILLLGWVIASLLSFLVRKTGSSPAATRMLKKSRVIDQEQDSARPVNNFSKIVFYLVLLLFLPGVLGALNIPAISEPLSHMLSGFFTFIPKLFGAVITVVIGYFVAKIVRDILTNFLQSVGLESLAARLGLTKVAEQTTLSAIIGNIAFVLILIPTVISALQTLDLQGISGPAVAMLNKILSMIPNFIVAIVMLLAGVWVGRMIGNFVSALLQRLGFDSLLRNLGLGKMESSMETVTLSQIAGTITQIVIILLFTIEALQIVGLEALVSVGTALLAYLPHVLVAVVIVGLGLWLGNLVQRLLITSLLQGRFMNAALLGNIAKYTIIALAFFMALDQLGVASSIVNAAFILILGGLALAFGLSFGLGGREFASNYLNKIQNKINNPVGSAGSYAAATSEKSVLKQNPPANQTHPADPITPPNPSSPANPIDPSNPIDPFGDGFNPKK